MKGRSYMQAIIRYELVINEALRSALMLDTPDEQIDEFIRFFGKHIGCDRIYIFEDNKKEHVTDNTYEWCRQGIESEIDYLQGVDMDIIDWWYKAFDKKENVIKTWTEISHQEKKPIRLNRYASSIIYFERPSYYLTEFNGDWFLWRGQSTD